jgi:DNA-binding MarR family transcriptional regulator
MLDLNTCADYEYLSTDRFRGCGRPFGGIINHEQIGAHEISINCISHRLRFPRTLIAMKHAEPGAPTLEEWGLWIYFLKAYKVVVDGIDKELRDEAPVSLAEFELLHLLRIADGRMRFIDLANITLLSQSRISRQVDALQSKGYLIREITASDRRATYAILTPEGERVHSRAIGPFTKALRSDFVDLVPKSKRPLLSELLKALLQTPDFREKAAEILRQARIVNSKSSSKAARPSIGRARRAS